MLTATIVQIYISLCVYAPWVVFVCASLCDQQKHWFCTLIIDHHENVTKNV